jgi:hypothetical protein
MFFSFTIHVKAVRRRGGLLTPSALVVPQRILMEQAGAVGAQQCMHDLPLVGIVTDQNKIDPGIERVETCGRDALRKCRRAQAGQCWRPPVERKGKRNEDKRQANDR